MTVWPVRRPRAPQRRAPHDINSKPLLFALPARRLGSRADGSGDQVLPENVAAAPDRAEAAVKAAVTALPDRRAPSRLTGGGVRHSVPTPGLPFGSDGASCRIPTLGARPSDGGVRSARRQRRPEAVVAPGATAGRRRPRGARRGQGLEPVPSTHRNPRAYPGSQTGAPFTECADPRARQVKYAAGSPTQGAFHFSCRRDLPSVVLQPYHGVAWKRCGSLAHDKAALLVLDAIDVNHDIAVWRSNPVPRRHHAIAAQDSFL